ncbi:GGDEF domain-containing protein [Acholeplasma equirhinis]|uniref:GGDEF domain-containing protein n=1 Tax=Acholeplasma equirhinis TaxID=555393 RepID=UPI00197AE03E|nr:GGDEF domain-containing protein [Acholeplasma equirhinis]MBN3490161.1 GGDEF domain-containing protein [Acholeplasma equirhinis]
MDQMILVMVVTVIAATIVFGLVFTHIYVKQVFKGIDFWIYGLIIEAVGFNLFLFGHIHADYTIYMFANMLLSVGLLFFYIGTNRFIQNDVSYVDMAIALSITYVMLVIFYYGFDLMMVRQITMSAYIIYVTGRLLHTLNFHYYRGQSGYLLPFIIVTYGLVFSQVIRIVLILFGLNFQPIFIEGFIVDDLIMLIISSFVAMLAFFMTIAVNIRMVNELNKEREKLQHLSMTDYLTILPNRRMLNQHIEMLIDKQVPFAVVISDMDEFKRINDRYGHDIGDKVIQAYAERLYQNKREGDFIARFGGDEFITVYSDLVDTDELRAFLQKKEKELYKPIEIDGHRFEISSSVGVAKYPTDATNLDAVIKKADNALYMVKTSGKRGMIFYSELKDIKK